ncbi:XRE family transcriptional regulator, partial [archaeon]
MGLNGLTVDGYVKHTIENNSVENMADLLGLSTTAYGDIERGKTDLTLSRLSQIATVL